MEVSKVKKSWIRWLRQNLVSNVKITETNGILIHKSGMNQWTEQKIRKDMNLFQMKSM